MPHDFKPTINPHTIKPVVLITGGAKRLGAQLCKTFTQAGWRVACHYNQSQSAAEELVNSLNQEGGDCTLFKADLADTMAVKHLFNHVLTTLGRIDCIINNASIFERDEGINFTVEQFLHHQSVNLLTPLVLGQALAAQQTNQSTQNQHLPCIVHILDQKVDNLNPDYFSYTVSKLALRDCVRLQAQALAPYVRVLGVSPGLIYVSGPQSEENFKRAASINLLKTPTDPSNVAKAVLDLVSNPAINGAIVQVDSGQHLLPLARDVMFLVE
jgi:NAD(P)-dependent dehydrogenase (short-subunit alcohol dehydrogenase family)